MHLTSLQPQRRMTWNFPQGLGFLDAPPPNGPQTDHTLCEWEGQSPA